MTLDLEFLKEVFKDPDPWLSVGTIMALGPMPDGSQFRVQVQLLPEDRQVIGFMQMADIYDCTIPEIGDLVIVAFVEKNPNLCYVIARYNSNEEPIPVFALGGHSVKYARPGKKLYLGSDTKIALARPNKEPSQPLVLGTVMVNALTALCNAFLNAPQIGQSPAGPVFLDASVQSALNTFISTYLTTSSTNILSQIGYTERGTE